MAWKELGDDDTIRDGDEIRLTMCQSEFDGSVPSVSRMQQGIDLITGLTPQTDAMTVRNVEETTHPDCPGGAFYVYLHVDRLPEPQPAGGYKEGVAIVAVERKDNTALVVGGIAAAVVVFYALRNR